MKFSRAKIPDLIICEPEVFEDQRGHFFESFSLKKFTNFIGQEVNFVQDNQSKSCLGVMRGLHFQRIPFAQSKLVRVINGSVLDVAVDLRKSSKTFGKYFAILLSEKNRKQLFIPKGFAHGFYTLEDNTTVAYKVDEYYNKDADSGLIYNDKILNINWKIKLKNLKVSSKDLSLPSFNESEVYFD